MAYTGSLASVPTINLTGCLRHAYINHVSIDGVNGVVPIGDVLAELITRSQEQEQEIGIMEFAMTSDVEVRNGETFFVMPAKFDGYKISYVIFKVASASPVDSDFELMVNNAAVADSQGTIIGGETFTEVSGIDAVLATGDCLSLNILNVDAAQAPKGLTATIVIVPA